MRIGSTKGLEVRVWLVCSGNSEEVNVVVEEAGKAGNIGKKIKGQIK